ncbi:MAG: hypothetical protein EBV36_07585 [Burkholderiaceae bacterium]|nr:hypothetical protein [Burkholderiaceae bacterium]
MPSVAMLSGTESKVNGFAPPQIDLVLCAIPRSELITAKKRGVDISIVVDMHSGLGASAKMVAELKNAGIKILLSQGVQLLHHKFVYIDGQTLITGSANWTKAAFTKNSDCLIILHNLSQEQKTFMNRLWRRIETTAKG